MERRYQLAHTEHRVQLGSSEGRGTCSVDGVPVAAQLRTEPDGTMSVRMDGVSYRALVHVSKDHTDVCVDGFHFRLSHGPAPRVSQHGGVAGAGAERLVSPMTGRVRRVLVTEGESVEAGATLVIVEAMKMEFPLRAAISGTVTKIHAAEGEPVELGAPLADLAPRPADLP